MGDWQPLPGPGNSEPAPPGDPDVIVWAEISGDKLTLRRGDVIKLDVTELAIGGLRLWPGASPSKVEIRLV
jgi:hypothetical protein